MESDDGTENGTEDSAEADEQTETTVAYNQPVDDENLWETYEPLPPPAEPIAKSAVTTDTIAPSTTVRATAPNGTLPPHWPDASRFTPAPPCAERPPCVEHHGPVMSHTRIYHSDDPDFVEALSGYAHFRNDDRFGGWETYLQRSEDFIRFCCHLHISEMLSARGGAEETRVVCEWPASR